MKKESAAQQGVEDAWDFWLSQHPVTVPEIIEEAVKKAFTDWLNANGDEIIEAIAKQARGAADHEHK